MRKHHNGWERNAPATTCTLPWLILFCVQSGWKDWHWFVQYHKILGYETRCSIVHPLPCSEANTASLEESALERLYKRKGITCLQCLTRLTWCFPLAIQSMPSYVSLVKKEFFTQMGLALLVEKCNNSSSALTMWILWLLTPAGRPK